MLSNVPRQGLLTLRDDFARFCRVSSANQNTPPLKKIHLIGAFPDENDPSIPDFADYSALGISFSIASQMGVAISPEFEPEIINIYPKYGGRDFLKDGAAADMLVFCFVFNPPEKDLSFFSASPGMSPNLAISPLHFEKNVWHDAAVRTGAKLLAISGGDYDEINARHFLPDSGSQFEILHRPAARDCGITLLRRKDFVLAI